MYHHLLGRLRDQALGLKNRAVRTRVGGARERSCYPCAAVFRLLESVCSQESSSRSYVEVLVVFVLTLLSYQYLYHPHRTFLWTVCILFFLFIIVYWR